MRIALEYNHLNAREYLIVNRTSQLQEIRTCLQNVNANDFLKISFDKTKLGCILYDQKSINAAIKNALNELNWDERVIHYCVTNDEETTRELINVHEEEDQQQILQDRGLPCYRTYNQVDFQKDRIAIEIQFGKYFSVAYDLHVKHTLFYSRNDIDVGIEVIPTKAMEERMDTGVPWFENEFTNVIREGRTNPPVPILILGIEPEEIRSREPVAYNDEELIRILRNSDVNKLRGKIQEYRNRNQRVTNTTQRIEIWERIIDLMEEDRNESSLDVEWMVAENRPEEDL